jgi:hypothetical protein
MTNTPTITPEFRVAVARDVLERVVPLVRPEPNTYVRTDRYTGRICEACATGMIFLALISPEFLGGLELDGANVGERYIQMLADTLPGQDLELSSIATVLEQVFTPEQLGLIEAAFMGSFNGKYANRSLQGPRGQHNPSFLASYLEPDEVEEELNPESLEEYRQLLKARDYDKWGVPAERLEHIMKNIIRNGGEFVP